MKEGGGGPVAARQAQPADLHSRGDDARTDGRMKQQSLLLMLPLKPGQQVEEELMRLLERIAHPGPPYDLEFNPVIPFKHLRSVHFARILLLPAAAGPPKPPNGPAESAPVPAQLLFATDFDGTLRDHLIELIDVAAMGLDELFSYCAGWPGLAARDRTARYEVCADFVARHSIAANTFYTGTMNRSVAQIHREAELRDAIERFLDDIQTGSAPMDAPGIRNRLRTWIFNEPRFAWVHERPGGFPRTFMPARVADHPKRSFVVAAVVLAAAIAGFFAFANPPAWVGWTLLLVVVAGAAKYGYLSHLARTDPVIIGGKVNEHAADLVGFEDRIIQNQISTINYIKRPLWFRRGVLQTVLRVVNVSAKFLENQGTLSGIPSIHFARWVIVDNGRRLLFFSNFDGSWESYLGDFVDKAHHGLTAIWSNTVGFPRTRGLWGEGATDEQRFKALARDSQVVTHVWYSAYRWLTVSNINDNTRLRLGLYGEMDEAAARAWLRMAKPRRRIDTAPAPVATSEIEKVTIADVQGLVVRSYKDFKHAVYVPVTFPSDVGDGARGWLRDLVSHVDHASASRAQLIEQGEALNVAFTYDGLAAFGLDAKRVFGYSREFIEGMAGNEHRQRLLGDTGDMAPETWKWGGLNRFHAMLFLFAGDEWSLQRLTDREHQRARHYGLALGPLLATTWLGQKEHFGYNDGIAQPVVAGLERGDNEPGDRSRIPAGEVILGYRNAYGRVPMSPTVDKGSAGDEYLEPPCDDPAGLAKALDFGRNGSYVVFRQLEQDVKSFWTDVHERAGGDKKRRDLLAAKMVGRWRDGTPLVGNVDGPKNCPANDFMYAGDLDGDQCPIGAHIRRTNPRDGLRPDTQESLRVSGRHRLLRRGRAYGDVISETFDPDEILKSSAPAGGRGLHFICFNTDIARQFEFVQSAWMNNVKFDGLYGDPDPVIAPHPVPSCEEEIGSFTLQRSPVRSRYRNLTRFVTMVGGAYLFMPGIKAMHYLAVSAPTGTRSSRD